MLIRRFLLVVAIPMSLAAASSTLVVYGQRGKPWLGLQVSLALTAVTCALAITRSTEQRPAVKLVASVIGCAILGFIWNFTVVLMVWSFSAIAAFGLLVAIVGALAGMLVVAWRESSLSTTDVVACALGTWIALTVDAVRMIQTH